MSQLTKSSFFAGALAVLLCAGAGWAQSTYPGGSAPSGSAPRTPAEKSAAPASGSLPTGPGSLTGTWNNAIYKASDHAPAKDRVLIQSNGEPAPLQPWARELTDKRIADSDAGHPFLSTVAHCLPGGVPEMNFGAGYPIQILETPGQVTMLFDEQNHFRIIRLNQPHAADPDPSYMGDSVGHWEGDTLVVDTVALKDKTTLDMVGTPHSDQLHVVERFRRIAPDRLEVLVNLDDPKAFLRPWIARGVFRMASASSGRMDEYICEEDPSFATSTVGK